jgi:hypothetical protein
MSSFNLLQIVWEYSTFADFAIQPNATASGSKFLEDTLSISFNLVASSLDRNSLYPYNLALNISRYVGLVCHHCINCIEIEKFRILCIFI